MPKKLLLFDFDGTIADTIETAVSIINEKGPDYGMKIHIDKKDLKRLKGETPLEVMKEFNVPLLKLPFFVTKVRGELLKRMDQVPVTEKLEKVLKSLNNQGFTLCIVTSNSEENVRKFLNTRKIPFFSQVYSNKNIFRKAATLNTILKEKNLRPDEVLYIGDEVRDIEACNKVGIPIIAVSWGFNTRELLAKYHPEWLVDTPDELMSVIERLC